MASRVKRDSETISLDTRQLISKRYHTITKAVNEEFWDSTSDVAHSLYVGSYGRGTAIDASDIDILLELPEVEYNRYDSVKGNGQSRLLQAVKDSIISAYPNSDIHADGQVVIINFSNGMKFEVLPAFKRNWFGYQYPDTNMGGNWRTTNPKAEQDALREKNNVSNGLLFDTCKHIRRIHTEHYKSYHLSGIVIDSFVYNAIGTWHWLSPGEEPGNGTVPYEETLLNYFNNCSYNGLISLSLAAPGSNQNVVAKSSMECLRKILTYMVE